MMNKNSFLIGFFITVSLLLSGCGSGGGVVGEYIDKEDSSSNQNATTTDTIVTDNTVDFFNLTTPIEDDISSIYTEKNTQESISISDSNETFSLEKITYLQYLEKDAFKELNSSLDNNYIKNDILKIYNAESTHYNASFETIGHYGEDNSYSSYIRGTTVPSFYSSLNYNLDDISLLKIAAKIEEKSIQDIQIELDKANVIDNVNILELYTALHTASKNHLTKIISLIYNNGGTYQPVLLEQTLYDEIVGATSTTNFTLYNQYDENNITKTFISNNGANTTLSSETHKESLKYISRLKDVSNELFLILKTYNSVTSQNSVETLLTKIFQAETTHQNALNNMIGYYSLATNYETYENSHLDTEFPNDIYSEIDSSSTLIEVLKKLALIQEKNIYELSEDIKSDISDNEDLLNLYNHLLIGSKNHLLLILKVLYSDGISEKYTPSILTVGIGYDTVFNEIIGELYNTETATIVSSSNPYVNIYSYLGDYNTTKLSLSQLDTSAQPYYINTTNSLSMKYILEEESLTASIFENYITSLINDVNSTYLTTDNIQIKDKLMDLNNSEKTHYETLSDYGSLFNVTKSADSELYDFFNDINKTYVPITDEIGMINLLEDVAKIYERSICDLNMHLTTGITQTTTSIVSGDNIINLYKKLENASINHIKIVVETIQNLQGTYTPQILGVSNCGDGVTFESKVGIVGTPSIDENIDVYLTVNSNGLSSVNISEKNQGSELDIPSLKQINSLKYIEYLINESNIITTVVNTNKSTFDSNTSFSLIDNIITEENSHISSMTNALDIYNVTQDSNNSSIDEFTKWVNDIRLYNIGLYDSNTTQQNIMILETLAIIKERTILDLEDHILNEVEDNADMIHIYTALENANKNHLKIIDKLLTDNFAKPYSCQLLTEEFCSSILPFSDNFISGTPVTNP